MLSRWIANTKRVLAKDKLTQQQYEFESVFPDGSPDGTAFSTTEMNKIIDAVNANTESTQYIFDNDQYIPDVGTVMKLPGGFMAVHASYPSAAAIKNPQSGMYEFTVSFPEVFSEVPNVFATARYPQGLITTCISQTYTASVKIGASASVSGARIQWLAIGRWQ